MITNFAILTGTEVTIAFYSSGNGMAMKVYTSLHINLIIPFLAIISVGIALGVVLFAVFAAIVVMVPILITWKNR